MYLVSRQIMDLKSITSPTRPRDFHTGDKAAALSGRFAGVIFRAIALENLPSVKGVLGNGCIRNI
ncbi:hypothetical protein AB205_0033200 [Aquarana catesbeiana]|uniref:Uncharacterized protein n=1 Tax=Aquarana catesbeiana TaxID=8400 RepID=A0A2G9SAX0_AQUCT|nr:hypothetical protein AB205_0033200 [Aquarana catesbeiana]